VIFQATSGKSWRKLDLGQARIMANHISLFPVPPMITCPYSAYDTTYLLTTTYLLPITFCLFTAYHLFIALQLSIDHHAC